MGRYVTKDECVEALQVIGEYIGNRTDGSDDKWEAFDILQIRIGVEAP